MKPSKRASTRSKPRTDPEAALRATTFNSAARGCTTRRARTVQAGKGKQKVYPCHPMPLRPVNLAKELGLFLSYPQLIVGYRKNRGCQIMFHTAPYLVEARGLAPFSSTGT